MKQNITFSHLWPHLAVLLFFFLLALAYNYPILEGKKLVQNDMIQAQGSAQALQQFQKETGRVSLWNNAMFSGMPSFLIYMDYPLSLSTQLGRAITYAVPYPLNLFFLYLAGFYLMAVMLGYRMELALLGALGFAFASYNVINIEAGHVSKAIAVAFAPPFIGAVILTYRGNIALGSALAGIFASIEIYANHIQITYYIVLALFCYALMELGLRLATPENRPAQLKAFVLASLALLLAGGLAVGSHASRLLTNYAYSQQSIRGQSELRSNTQSRGGTDRDYAFQWSYGIGETFTFIIPHFYGGGSGIGAWLGTKSNTAEAFERNRFDPKYAEGMPYYWGGQPFTSGPAYMGAVLFFLFVMGIWLGTHPIKWWLLGMVLLFTALAWGKNFAPFNDFIFDYLPLYNKFRAVTMVLSVVPLFLAWGAMLGLEALMARAPQATDLPAGFRWSAGLVAGICLFFALLGGAVLNYQSEAYQEIKDEKGKITRLNQDEAFRNNLVNQLQGNEAVANDLMEAIRRDRAAMQRQDAWRSFIFIALAIGLIWLGLKKYFPFSYALWGLAALTLIDLYAVDQRYLNEENYVRKSRFESYFEPSEADRKILADKALYFRVFNTTVSPFNDATTSYHHASIGGYHGAKLRRYQDLIERHLSQNNLAVLNMLNTKYFIVGGPSGELLAQQNPGAMGNAWFVSAYKMVKNADAEIEALQDFDPAKTAIIAEAFAPALKGLKIQPDAKARIRLTGYAPDELSYEYEASRPQLAVFSDIYYVNPGESAWQAYLDGKPVAHFRANYVLRAMALPAGKHRLTFRFESPLYQKGETIALICSLALLLALGLGAYWALRTAKGPAASTDK
ncbi:MAG: YfhO family protein [Microscillaceae bacterium]